MSAEIPYLKLVTSKGHDTVGDCGICAIGTLVGKEYEDVVVVASQVAKNWKNGLWLKDIIAIAAEFGFTLKRRRKYDLETAVGILDVDILIKGEVTKHVVLLNAGQIIDSDGTLWTPDAYISAHNAKLGSLLEPV